MQNKGTETNAGSTASLDAHLAEYTALREELLARYESQRQSFNYLVVIISGTVSASVYLAQLGRSDLVSFIALFLPVIVAPLGFIFFDNELMLHANGFYIFKFLGKRISQLVKDDVLLVERERKLSLGKPTWIVHRWLSIGRWILFLGPVIGPMIYIVTSTDYWWKYPYVLVFAADCALALILISGTIAAFRVNQIWVNLAR